MEERYYTTWQAAEILGVNPYQPIDMYDKGLLKGFRTPTKSRHRRISASSLIALMKKDRLLENDCFIRDRKKAWKIHGFDPFTPEQQKTPA